MQSNSIDKDKVKQKELSRGIHKACPFVVYKHERKRQISQPLEKKKFDYIL